jgi:hypothetical protein
VDDRHSNHRGIVCDIVNMDFTELPFTAQGKKETSEFGDEFFDEDRILALLDAYPENATAADQSVPLTKEELSCKSHPPEAIEVYQSAFVPRSDRYAVHAVNRGILKSATYTRSAFAELSQIRDDYCSASYCKGGDSA